MMATQGMVTLMQGGKVRLKIVVGCDGYNAKLVADEIVRRKSQMENVNWSIHEPFMVEFAQNVSQRLGMGCSDCRVVVTEKRILHREHVEVNPLYRGTFTDPMFNPRWEKGDCYYRYVVDLDKMAVDGPERA